MRYDHETPEQAHYREQREQREQRAQAAQEPEAEPEEQPAELPHVHDLVPEWRDSAREAREKDAAMDWALRNGLSPSDLASLDARGVKAVRDAWLADGGLPSKQQRRAETQRRKEEARNGRLMAAAAALEAMLDERQESPSRPARAPVTLAAGMTPEQIRDAQLTAEAAMLQSELPGWNNPETRTRELDAIVHFARQQLGFSESELRSITAGAGWSALHKAWRQAKSPRTPAQQSHAIARAKAKVQDTGKVKDAAAAIEELLRKREGR